MEREHSTLTRRSVLFGVPSLYLVLGILHPMSNPRVGDDTELFIWLHLAQLVLIGGVGWMFWLLVEGLDSRAATVTRALILPFVIWYTALDAVLGVAWGIAAREATELPAADHAAMGRLLGALLDEPEPSGYILYFGAGLVWLALALSAVAAVANRAPRPALALMAVGATVFGMGHAKPMGPIGMALFLAGVVWLELRPRREAAGEATSLQGA